MHTFFLSSYLPQWKNNVERKNKFKLLQEDANVPDDCDEKTRQRSNYCRNAISIALSIKNFFSRTITKNGADEPIIQYLIPYPMPQHMMTMNCSSSSSSSGGGAISMGQHVPTGSSGASVHPTSLPSHRHPIVIQ